MVEFIAKRIIESKNKGGVEVGQDKYRAYFVNTKLYAKYKVDVNSILEIEGCGDCIIKE